MAVQVRQSGVKTIMIAEGDTALQEVLTRIISEETPYQSLPLPVFSTCTLLRDIRANKPHLLLLDCHLPRVDVSALCNQLQIDCEPDCLPVILTSTNPPKQRLSYEHMAFLTKPFELEELLATIERLLDS